MEIMNLGQINESMGELNSWSLSGSSIEKTFSFSTFHDALHFVDQVGEIAEKLEHHPDILISEGSVRLTLVTHSTGCLTGKDFEVARGIDKL